MENQLYSRLSIRQKWPLLVCGLLLAVMLTFGTVSYIGVRNTSLKNRQEHLLTLSFDLSEMLSAQNTAILSTLYSRANKPAVKAFLRSGGRDSVQAINNWFDGFENDSSTAYVDLLNADHKSLRSAKKTFNISVDSLLAKTKESSIGKLYTFNHSIVYPVIAEITDSNKVMGYFIRWRIMQATPKSVERLTTLMGKDVKIYVGNADSSLWTDFIRPVTLPHITRVKANSIVDYKRTNERWLASMRPSANSPWLVSVELPKNKALQTADAFLHWLVISGSILLLLGIFFGWLMSRNFSAPLIKLTSAASEIADGNFSSHIFVNRSDELGKLARSFNAMSAQVKNSQQQLEQEARNYRMLFEKNPMPMWIMSKNDYNMLDVNEAALLHYGYSRQEFLSLNGVDIRPEEDLAKFLNIANKGLGGNTRHGIWRHKRKNGTVFMADVVADDIIYKGEPARLTLVNDVTEKLKAEAELVKHRIMQQEIITETTILVQEKEREEIGKELHDNINQILASTKLYLEMARNGNMVPLAISKSYENVNLAIQEIRHLSKQLVRPEFDTSLYDSLRDLTEEIEAITPVSIAFSATNFNEALLNENLKLMTYRVVQEQLNNILKHAAASEIFIDLKTDDEVLSLVIEDNGVGFDPDTKAKGIGLRNIESRTQFYKGSLRLITSPGQGCRLEIIVPLLQQPVSLDKFDVC